MCENPRKTQGKCGEPPPNTRRCPPLPARRAHASRAPRSALERQTHRVTPAGDARPEWAAARQPPCTRSYPPLGLRITGAPPCPSTVSLHRVPPPCPSTVSLHRVPPPFLFT